MRRSVFSFMTFATLSVIFVADPFITADPSLVELLMFTNAESFIQFHVFVGNQ